MGRGRASKHVGLSLGQSRVGRVRAYVCVSMPMEETSAFGFTVGHFPCSDPFTKVFFLGCDSKPETIRTVVRKKVPACVWLLTQSCMRR